jgi:Zn-dependent peptidase ImmA (M78 family)
LGSAIERLQKRRASIRIEALAKRHSELESSREERFEWLAALRQYPPQLASRLSKPLPALVVSPTPALLALFGSLSPNVRSDDVSALLALVESAKTSLAEPANSLHYEANSVEPHNQGYELAEHARSKLGLKETELPDLERIFRELGYARKSLNLSDQSIRAVALCGERITPTVALNESCAVNHTDPGKRFTLAHELCHLLFDRLSGVPLAVASGPWAPLAIEQRANVFAAGFLMPDRKCRELFNEYSAGNLELSQVVRNVAKEMGTGKTATLEHLRNRGILSEAEKELIAEEFGNLIL